MTNIGSVILRIISINYCYVIPFQNIAKLPITNDDTAFSTTTPVIKTSDETELFFKLQIGTLINRVTSGIVSISEAMLYFEKLVISKYNQYTCLFDLSHWNFELREF